MRITPLISLFLLCACAGNRRDSEVSREVEETVRRAEIRSKESQTLSALAKLEEGLSAFTRAERRIPKSLDKLIPKYLAEIPAVETSTHKENSSVMIYPPNVLRDGQIDGSRLRDTGGWGYIATQRQIVVFIDCTHPTTRGEPWYKARGVF
ncbi:MAG: hypothetical protein HY549_10620 [Elusimicrobia bacterium]|nr:hypothetical protein [Elusimicrobiota bacterium]